MSLGKEGKLQAIAILSILFMLIVFVCSFLWNQAGVKATIVGAPDALPIHLSQTTFRAYNPSLVVETGLPLAATNTSAVLPMVGGDFRVRIGLTNMEEEQGPEVSSISAGSSHACAIRTNGRLYCWGGNAYGQLGVGDGLFADKLSPTSVSDTGFIDDKKVIAVSSGGVYAGDIAQTCAITEDHVAYCWGRNNYGQLGNGSTSDSDVPVLVDTSGILAGKDIASISVGGAHVCAVTVDGVGACWGAGGNGRLGRGSTFNSSVPVAVSKGDVPVGEYFLQIAAGTSHTCAIASDNKAYCWGAGAEGRLGNGSTANATTPSAVSTAGVLSGKTALKVVVADLHSCLIASDNNVYCWANGAQGKLGDGLATNSLVPVAVSTVGVLAGKTVVDVSVGVAGQACVLASDNQVYCWGAGGQGALGKNSSSDSLVPAAIVMTGVLSGKTIQSLSVGRSFVCVVASDDKVYCWGYQLNGRLANGQSSGSSAVPVSTLAGDIQTISPRVEINQLTARLQVAPREVDGCSSSNSGWQDVSSTSDINWGVSPPSSNTAIGAIGADPILSIPGSYSYQSIVQGGSSFTNSTAIMPRQTALWDFVLHDRSLKANAAYCLRIVAVNGAVDEYDVYPKITTALGQLSMRFVDSSGDELDYNDAKTVFPVLSVHPGSQVSSVDFTNTSTKILEVHNSSSNSGWNVALAATDGPSAAWSSGALNYPYNDTAANGRLTAVLSNSSVVAVGTTPTGSACSATNGITVPTSDISYQSGVIDAVTLLIGSSSADFNCRWRIQNIGLSQTIPAGQKAGSYDFKLTATVVAQ